MSPMYHRNTRNPHMVAEQEFRTTTLEPASQRPRRRDSQPHTSQQGSQEMLENATSVTTFGKKDTAAESQSHAARTQDTLVNAVENAEVNEIIRAVFRALTRLKATETKELDHDCPTWNADHQREQRDLPTRNRVSRVQDSACCRRA